MTIFPIKPSKIFGIGEAIYRRGGVRYIFGRRQALLAKALAELGANARAVAGSVTDLADLNRLFAAVEAERGSLDILLANAEPARWCR